ncbi:EAL domain-containing protein [soil metagenome]
MSRAQGAIGRMRCSLLGTRGTSSLMVGVGAALALTFLLVYGWGDGGAIPISIRLPLLGLSVYATVCTALAARFARGRARRGWQTMVVALAAWATGDAVQLLYEIGLPRVPFPGPPTYLHLASSVLAAAAMAFFLTAQALGSRLRLLLDGVTAALCLSMLCWVTALHRAYDSGPRPGIALVVVALFHVGDLLALTIAVLVLVRSNAHDRGVLWMLTGAIALVAATHNAFAYLVVSGGHNGAGGLAELVWAAALMAFAAAALSSRRVSPPSTPAPPAPSKSSMWLPYVPLLLAGTVDPALVMSGLERILVPLVVVAVCGRQMVAAWENRRLLTAAADYALRDPLTGLANRALFDDRLARAMMLRQRDGRSVAVVSLDLDDFKLVNDSFGHPAADNILVHVGQRISACVRPGDTVARDGGDEFVLLLEGRTDQSHLVAERVVEAFHEPFLINGETLLMHCSVGIAVASPAEPGLTAETLVTRADIAMDAAKRAHMKGLHTFSPDMAVVKPDVVEMNREADGGRSPTGDGAALRLLGELRHATHHKGLDVLYQPKVDLRTDRIIGVEALLRWPHPQLGVLRPDAFLSLVRQHGLMRPVTELVLDKALDDVARWGAQGIPMPVAVNVFAPYLRDERLPDALIDALRRRDLAPDLLTIEITEDVVLSEVDRGTGILDRLREHGIRIAIDDFGSGYSALTYLRDLPIDEVKLDRHFIKSVIGDARATAVVRAVIGLARELDLTVVAEGVEDAATVDWLRGQGCDIGQGYLFGRPMRASAIAELIRPGRIFDVGTFGS